MAKFLKKFVVGVDGGGTKTVAALTNLKGKIIKIAKAGPANLRNVGVKKAMENVAKAIEKVLPKKGKILSTFIGLAAFAEEFKEREKEILKELKKHKKISPIFEGKVKLDSDQKIAFFAGAEKKGVILICGTGLGCRGFLGEKEVKVSGWGYLADEGSAFFIGQKVFQAVMKDLDKREKRTILTDLIFKKWKFKKKTDILDFVYKNPPQNLAQFSKICDLAAKRGDKIAKKILKEAAREAALSAKTAIREIGLKNKKFPLVLSGSVFKSEIFKKEVIKQIKKFSPKAKIILLKKEPVIGAIKLALRELP